MADLKTRLSQLLDLSHSFQQQLIADLDPVEHDASGTWEDWSIKDELAHVIAWQFNSLARIAALIHAEPVPIARLNYNVPPDFERIIRKCLEKHPDRRYQSAQELLIDLKNLLRDLDSGPRTPPGTAQAG